MPDGNGIDGLKASVAALSHTVDNIILADREKWKELLGLVQGNREQHIRREEICKASQERTQGLLDRVAKLESQREMIAWRTLGVGLAMVQAWVIWKLTH